MHHLPVLPATSAPFTPAQDIPTLGQWGMIVLTLSLIGLAVFTLSRQRQLNL